ncbi:MAG: polyketide synthase dehydratase domain-containing protein, partial [Acidobacteriota bacterium]|nr:polyketide synthase dehydratase domain-containing protein [Acidobacteriota bacterium]
MQTIVTPHEGGCGISIAALADAAAGRWVEHMSCAAQPLPAASEPGVITPIDTVSSMTGARFYDESDRRGIEYGPAFRSLVRLDSHPGGYGSAQFALPASPSADYHLDPVLLDTALQALAATRSDLGERTYIPASIACLEVSGAMIQSGRVACHWDSAASRDRSAMCALSIADHDGTTRVRLDGIRMREVGEPVAADSHAPIWLPVWEPAPPVEAPPAAAGTWIVAGDDAALADEVAARLGASVVSGPSLVRTVAQPAGSIAGVCYLAVARSLESGAGIAEVLALVQALGALAESRQPRLVIVTRGAQAIGLAAGGDGARRAQLWGLARVVRNEHPALRCACVDLDPIATDEECADAVASECRADDEDQVAWRNNARLALRLRAAQAVPAADAPAPARLVCRSIGNLDSLAFEPASPRSPGTGEVLVAVRAAGLNFKDVLHALGVLEMPAQAM